MKPRSHLDLSRRERQIMEAVYKLGSATVSDVMAELPDPPSYSAVRAMLGKLEAKGCLEHRQEGPRYLYLATVPRQEARESALQRLVRTFFDGSTEKAVTALLGMSAGEMTDEELDRLSTLIEEAKKGGQ
ncbi:MAG TPA: BlaI/MecI/CopY family transcriptional regulator [Thermoanaerobaculia bacterium]|jgi:BlaI family transcriptional regulator, penicillinase repressor|nr:BlaI/MecI/CopY family transcriptional regulator [Thermoanaerobaculia bacterium]